MFYFKSFILFYILSISTIGLSENKFPIVLVHGFLGWGELEMGKYKYWGGKNDIASKLREEGFIVYVTSVGPISSNWDRAVELYYQIKGGQVDYGYRHSKKFGLIQKPNNKSYKGLYTKWDSNNPIHLIGHSMGGQTIRMLQYLLENEFLKDSLNNILEHSDLLKNKNKNYIKSITSFATPHNGTTLVNLVPKMLPLIKYFINISKIVGGEYYNFDLNQWGFKRNEGETWFSYSKRMKNHRAWETKNISAYDLSVDGAAHLNSFLRVSEDIYYFSYSFSSTHNDLRMKNHIADKTTFITLRPRANLIGSIKNIPQSNVSLDSSWLENDGVVNTISMSHPFTGTNGEDPIVLYDKNRLLNKGIWNTFKTIKMDHYQSVGHFMKKKSNIDSIYVNHAKILKYLH
tara:strand:- start:831 stop:2036 length:1206 start_codon:yes stop_codon:yes gene_type:complete